MRDANGNPIVGKNVSLAPSGGHSTQSSSPVLTDASGVATFSGLTINGGVRDVLYVATMEDRGVDSLWLSEVVTAPLLDPVVAMGYVVARTRNVKVGTGVMVLPGTYSAGCQARSILRSIRLYPFGAGTSPNGT